MKMKHLKTFEKRETENQVELLGDLLSENPANETHDFYIFLASEKFVETDGGLYKKTVDIERMIRITPDEASVSAMKGMQMRAMVQQGVRLYHIWLPQEIREDIEGKGGDSIEPWLVNLIDEHKRAGDVGGEGRKVMKDVQQRNRDMKKYNL